MTQPTYWWLQLVGRLKPGASIEQAQANFATVFQRTAKAGMAEYQSSLTAEEKSLSFNRQRGDAVPELLVRSAAHGYYDIDPQAQRSAGFLAVVVVIVLLIVCANVANLLLSRATSRHREISVRLSMGATRGRLVRQLLTESLLLSSLGGVLGVLVGYWSRALLPFGEKAPLDWRVFGFVAGVSLLTGIVFGLLPALRATGVDLAGAMKESSRSVTGSRTLLSKALVVRAGGDVAGAARRRRPVPADAREPEERGRRVRLEEPADVPREPERQSLRSGAFGAGLPPGARADVVAARRDVCRADAHDAALGQHEHELDVDAGPDVADRRRRERCT